ncbi:thioesterase superfamily protein [Mycolicibacterium rhodesiae JS60]|nr:thioesterase superfamily protein [Mycolicibacterium rhodesiae JS60]
MADGADESDLLAWVGSDFQALPKSDGGVPLCGACRAAGDCRLGVRQEVLADGVVTSDLVCPAGQEGGPNVAHGGWTAAVMDEMLGHLPLHHNQLSVTATLTIDFIKPVPIERPLRARAWVDKVDGSKWYVSGELLLLPAGAVLAKATGVWVARDPSHFLRHQQWLAAQEGIQSD